MPSEGAVMKDVLARSIDELSRSLERFPWTDRDAYCEWLAQTYYYVRHSTRLLAAAAARFACDDSGDTLGKPFVHEIPIALALSPGVLAVLTTQAGPDDRISWFSTAGGKKIGSALVSPRAAPQLATSDQLTVFRVYRQLYGISTHGGRPRLLAKTAQDSVGLSLAHGRLAWADNRGDTGRLRALSVR